MGKKSQRKGKGESIHSRVIDLVFPPNCYLILQYNASYVVCIIKLKLLNLKYVY